LSGFHVSELPPGFKLTVEGAQTIGDASAPASHLVYSDGLATVSVFIEAEPPPAPPASAAAGATASGAPASGIAADPLSAVPDAPVQGLARVGSGYAFSTVVQGHQVTAVGEVPALTVEFIAHSVKGGAAPAPH
jgi:sigma-E factor negative regulatory protein RseB